MRPDPTTTLVILLIGSSVINLVALYALVTIKLIMDYRDRLEGHAALISPTILESALDCYKHMVRVVGALVVCTLLLAICLAFAASTVYQAYKSGMYFLPGLYFVCTLQVMYLTFISRRAIHKWRLVHKTLS